ncbi:hypothetical protein Tco_1141598 [Tanacetum coccineum]
MTVRTLSSSPAVTLRSIIPSGYFTSLENPTNGTLDSLSFSLVPGPKFLKQCSYITSEELPQSTYILRPWKPSMYASRIMRESTSRHLGTFSFSHVSKVRFLSCFPVGTFGRFKLLTITVEDGEVDAPQIGMSCLADGANVEANLPGLIRLGKWASIFVMS